MHPNPLFRALPRPQTIQMKSINKSAYRRAPITLISAALLLVGASVTPQTADASHNKRYAVYAIDLSAGTAAADESCTDLNGIDSSTQLDCELELVLALNDEVKRFLPVRAGVVGYAGEGLTADVQPTAGYQTDTAVGLDLNENNVEDLEEVVASTTGNGFSQFTPVSTATTTRDYDAALEAIANLTDNLPTGSRVQAALLSWGPGGYTSGPGTAHQDVLDQGTIVNGFSPEGGCQFSSLRALTDSTGGICVEVGDPPQPGRWFLAAKPDALIKRSTDTTFLGNNVYNTTGDSQTRTWSVKAGDKRTFNLKFQNDGTIADQLEIRGPDSSPKFKLSYMAGNSDVTAAVVAGTYSTSSLDPREAAKLTLEIKAKAQADPGDVRSTLIEATSLADGHSRDVVKAKVTVK